VITVSVCLSVLYRATPVEARRALGVHVGAVAQQNARRRNLHTHARSGVL